MTHRRLALERTWGSLPSNLSVPHEPLYEVSFVSHKIFARVLGPLTLALDNRNATPTAQKERQLLALLLIRNSSVVPVSTLIEELWSDNPPRTAVPLVQTYVLRIRKKIEQNLGVEPSRAQYSLIRTSGNGYLFNVGECVLDLRDYRSITAAARRALASGADERAVELFIAAESLWSGAPLLDLEVGIPLSAEVSHLKQLRLADLESRVQTQLRLGRDREACADLARLTIENPLDEHLQAHYLYALCRTGQRQNALESYYSFSKSLQRELGLRPTQELARLHAVILDGTDDSVAALLKRLVAGCLTDSPRIL